MEKLNNILKESMIEGHAYSFAYNLFKSRNVTSMDRFMELLFSDDGLKKEVTCLEYLSDKASVSHIIFFFYITFLMCTEKCDIK